jgi:NitT/TauT family transport system substrate-binding protein
MPYCPAPSISAQTKDTIAWDKARGTPQQIFGISGVTTQPLVLITNQEGIKSKDFKSTDRPAGAGMPQMYALQLASEKAFGPGQHDKLRPQVVALPHPESLAQITSGGTEITAYFSSAPFTQVALRNPKIKPVLTSTDAFGGKASFLVAGATKRYLDANPKMAEVFAKAIAEASDLIKSDPKRAT